MKSGGRTIIFKFLAPYLLILAIPVVIGMITYDRTIGVFESESTKANRTLLMMSKDTIDQRLDELNRITQQIMLDPGLNSFQYIDDPFEGANTFRTIELKNSLVDYQLFNHFISEYYIIFGDSQLVVTPSLVYDIHAFYEQMFQHNGQTFEEWFAQVMGQYHIREIEPASEYTIDGKTRQMVTYMQSLGVVNHPYATIVALIDNQQFAEMLGGLDIAGGGWAYIADDKGRIISSVTTGELPIPPDESRLGFAGIGSTGGTITSQARSNKMMTTVATSDYNGWRYIVSQPAHIVLEKVNYMKSMMLALLAISLLAGLLIAVWLAYRNSKPIRFLAKTFDFGDAGGGGDGPPGDVYQMIQDGIFQLKHSNYALREEMDKQRPMLRTAFIERLLKGELLMSENTQTVMDRLGIRMEGRAFVVAVLALSDHPFVAQPDILLDLDRKSLFIQDTISRMSDRVVFHAMHGNKMAWIIACESPEREECRAYVRELVSRMNREMESLHYEPSVGVGNIYASVEDIPRSYQEAEQALAFKAWKALEGMIWFSDLPQNSGSYYYPSDVEFKLMNFIKTGNRAEVQKLFSELSYENFVKRHLTANMIKLLLSNLQGSVCRLSEQITIDDKDWLRQLQALFAPSGSLEDAQITFQSIESTCISLCQLIERRKRSHNEQLNREILEMLHSHYHLANFSLTMIAERLHVSEVYLSYFIKEQTGVAFSEYLESLRMERAKELLRGDRYAVKDIAKRVGYQSSNTFCRAFKRLNGVSTTDYKRSILG